MKIEINEFDYDRLKDQLKESKERIKELEGQIEGATGKSIKEKILYNSFQLANLYLHGIFKKLGFKQSDQPGYFDRSIQDHEKAQHYLGPDWYLNPKLTVDVHVDIVNEWRNAFISLGINEKIMVPKEQSEAEKLTEI